MNPFKATSLIALMLVGITATQAYADDASFKKKHPRRAEVNKRIKNKKEEIKGDVKSGALTKAQGAQDLKDLRATKQAEISDAKANGGRITKDQQNNLNQRLNNEQQNINNQVGAGAPPKNIPTVPTMPSVPALPGTSH